jgi:hypothetical protein
MKESLSNRGQEEKGIGRVIKGRILEQHGARRKGEQGCAREEKGSKNEHGKNP